MKKQALMIRLGGTLGAVFAAMSLCMNFREPGLSNAAKGSSILNVIENIQMSLDGQSLLVTIVAVAFFLLWRYNNDNRQRRHILLPVCCGLLALIWTMGRSYDISGSLQTIFSGTGQMAKAGIYFLGSAWMLSQLGIGLEILMEKRWDVKLFEGKLLGFYRKHSFLCPFVMIALSCVFPLVLGYPGGMCADSWCQAGMFFEVVRPDYGLYEFTSHHPPAHTVFFSVIIELGRRLGSANLGLFMVNVLQALMYSAVFAYMLHTMEKLKAPAYLQILSLLVVLFAPQYVTYYALVIKDNVFSWAVLLLVTELTYMLRMKERYWDSRGHIALLALAIVGCMLMRNNGKYIIYPLVLILLLLRMGKKAAVCLVLPVLASALISSGLMSYYDIEKGSIREALSLPIQMTARYVRDYEAEVTEEEKAAISAVLDYENMGEDYSPYVSDPVKDMWNPEAGTAELLDYLKAWASMGLKHPGVYFEAAVHLDYNMVYPFKESGALYNTTLNEHHLVAAKTIGIEDVEILPRVNNIRDEINITLGYLPFAGPVTNLGVNVIVLMYLCCYALGKRRWDFLLCALPLLITAGVCLLSPTITGCPRYAYPIVYSMGMMMAWYYWLLPEKK